VFPAEHGITVLSARATCVAALRSCALSSDPGVGVGVEQANLLFMDGTEHARLRAVIRPIIARLEPLPAPLQRYIEDFVAELGSRPEFDLVADFARPVASAFAAAILDTERLPEADLEAVTANLDVWFGTAGEAETPALRLAMFFARDQGHSLLREALEKGEISEDEYLVSPVMLAHAAYENSLNFLALAGLRLTSEPELAAFLLEQPAATVRRLAHEIAPARFVFRRATDRVELPGHIIPAGQTVAIQLGPDTDSRGWRSASVRTPARRQGRRRRGRSSPHLPRPSPPR
jgi:cytochrome P450